MGFRVKSVLLAIGLLAFCLAVPLHPPSLTTLSPVSAQNPTPSTFKAEADRLLQQGIEQYRLSQFEAALHSWQRALTIYQDLNDLPGEANLLVNLGSTYGSTSQYDKAISYYQQALPILQQINDRHGSAKALINLGAAYRAMLKYDKAITYYQQALPILQQVNNRHDEATTLMNLGNTYESLSQQDKAISYYQQALPIFQQVNDRHGEAQILGNLGNAYRALSQYNKAISYYQQALSRFQQVKDRNDEAKTLLNLGIAYGSLSQYNQAISYCQQALQIFQQINDVNGKAEALTSLGIAYGSLLQYDRAITYYQQALPILQQIQNHNGEAKTLCNLGEAYQSLLQHDKAISYYQQALSLFQGVKGYAGAAKVLMNLGSAYQTLSQYDQAISYYQQALQIFQQVNDVNGEASTRVNLGIAYGSLAQYGKAISYYQQALPIFSVLKDRNSEAKTLVNLGNVYRSLSQYDQAISYYQQALSLFQQIKDHNDEASTLNSLGIAHRYLSQYDTAINYHQQALAIFQQVKDLNGKARALNNLGNAYQALSQYDTAISYHQQSLLISQQVKDFNGEANSLMNLGNAYRSLSQYEKAITYYQQALPLFQQVKDRTGEGNLLHNIGYLVETQKQPELAIAFYKQSVNMREGIRADIRSLSSDLQESYMRSVAGTYRRLADLLLAQGRVLEAQQVLELLKIQELRDYTHNTRTGGTPPGIDIDATERKILQAYNTLIDFGQKIRACQSRKMPCSDAELNQLVQLRNEQTQAIQQILKTLEAELAKRTQQDANALDPKNDLSRKAQEMIAAQPDTVLIYSLVTDDRLWVVLAAAGDVLRKFEVKVSQKELADTVLKLRQLLKNCESYPCGATNVKPVQEISQKLYNWLLPPALRQELQGNGTRQYPIRNLVFAPDRVTRYLPFAALFDGNHYLIENYTVSTIVSAKLTDTHDRLPANPQDVSVLALGLSNSVPPDFGSLPNVPLELDAIVKQTEGDAKGTFPGLQRLNQEFDWLTLQKNLYGHKILHIATHGKFIPGSFTSSYLLLGTGKPLPIPQIEQLSDLVGVHLVVLSACETALGGKREQDGLEIAGISNSFLERGAKSVLASLWQVNDSSTSQLMQRFYQNLATGKMTKAAALRQAQLAMLQGGQATSGDRRNFRIEPTQKGEPALISRDLSHPYYWAPFTLIGNGL